MYNGVDSCSIIGESSFGVLYSCLPQWMGETAWQCQIIALILVGRTATNTFNIDEDGMYHNCSAGDFSAVVVAQWLQRRVMQRGGCSAE